MSHPLKTLIIDDERHARDGLRHLLSRYSDIEVVGEAGDVEAALEEIDRLKPDVLFLDIQMPRKTGFDLIKEIKPAIKVVFVTAFDEYAIRAFEVNALDYLMKPVKPERLDKTIKRLLSKKKYPTKVDRKLSYKDILFVKYNSNMMFLNINQIMYINSAADYTDVYLASGRNGLVTKTMKEWELRLPEEHFIRIHRSTIVNVNYIQKVESWFNGKMRVYIKNKAEPLVISRRNASQIRKRLG